jgi:hypothetical protein
VGTQQNQKMLGVSYTCLTSRAVFLEVAPSLSTDDFFMVLRQFICRRGPPEELLSDNGSNFAGASLEIQESTEEWNQEKIQKELQQRGVKWVSPPTAAPMSGVWEILVQSTKRHLKVLVGDRLLTEFTLRTLVAEVGAILNARPLCAVSEDINDLEALTPNNVFAAEKSGRSTAWTVHKGGWVAQERMEESPVPIGAVLEKVDYRVFTESPGTIKMADTSTQHSGRRFGHDQGRWTCSQSVDPWTRYSGCLGRRWNGPISCCENSHRGGGGGVGPSDNNVVSFGGIAKQTVDNSLRSL